MSRCCIQSAETAAVLGNQSVAEMAELLSFVDLLTTGIQAVPLAGGPCAVQRPPRTLLRRSADIRRAGPGQLRAKQSASVW
jgi:hypothetical protein